MKIDRTGLVVGFVVGLVASFLVLNYSQAIFKSDVENNVKRFYELIYPDSQVEIVSLKDESGLYKVFVKITTSSGTSYQEVYVTKDGKLLTLSESTVFVESSIEQIEKSKRFVDCLFDKNVRIYGVLNQTENPQGAQATFLQLNLLGRLYSPKLYISCDGGFVQQCLDRGITQVPSAIVGNSIDTGIKTVDWFENKTGCKLS